MQKRKPGQPHKGWKSSADKAKHRHRGALVGWNFKLATMPTEGSFEVLRVYDEVFRHMPGDTTVIEPYHGRMFTPVAWRPMSKSD
jgi:hypothetical protein